MQLLSIKTEKMLLCAMMERKRVLQRAMPHLVKELFGVTEHCEIFERIIVLQQQGKEIPSSRVMAQDPGLSKQARATLAIEGRDRSTLHKFSKEDVDHSLDTLRHFYQKRVLFEMDKWVANELSSPSRTSISKVKSRIQESMVELEDFDFQGHLRTFGVEGNVTDPYLRDNLYQTSGKLMPTGFPAIDNRIGGWSKGNLVLLTAMRGQGKSLLAKSFSLGHYYNKANVFIANLEMEEWEYMLRIFAEESAVSHERLRSGTINSKVMKEVYKTKREMDAFGLINKCRWTLRTISNPMYNTQMLHNELKHQGYDVLVIDYVNLIASGKGELWENIYNATKYLKLMAKDLNILVYLLAQMQEDHRAKYARAAEEDADAWLHWELRPGTSRVLFDHGKARHYDPFSFELIFDGRKTRFVDPSELTPEEAHKIEMRAKRRMEIERKRREQLKGKPKPSNKGKKDKEDKEEKPKAGNLNKNKPKKREGKKNASKEH